MLGFILLRVLDESYLSLEIPIKTLAQGFPWEAFFLPAVLYCLHTVILFLLQIMYCCCCCFLFFS